MSEAKRLCANYKKLKRRQAKIQIYNELAGYEKVAPAVDNSNCDHCGRFIWIMPMKVCFSIRLRPRLLILLWKVRHFKQIYRFRNPIVMKEET